MPDAQTQPSAIDAAVTGEPERADEDEEEEREDERDGRDTVARVPPWAIAVAEAAALFLFGEHAYARAGAFPWRPETDALTLSWFVLVIVIGLLPYAERIGFSGTSVTLRRERARRAVSDAVDATTKIERVRDRLAETLQSWTNSAAVLGPNLERYGTSPDVVADMVTRFCLEIMNDAKALLVEERELVRLSLWWYVEGEGLAFVYGTDAMHATPHESTFRPGEGLLGQAFVEGRLYNIEDATRQPYYRQHRDGPSYRGLMLVPIREGNARVLGVLSIDRARASEFDAVGESIGLAVADLIAIAFTTERVTKTLADIDDAS